MKILATGTAGMLGSSLVPALVGAGHDVTATDIDVGNRSRGDPGVRGGHLDVRNREEIRAVTRRELPTSSCTSPPRPRWS